MIAADDELEEVEATLSEAMSRLRDAEQEARAAGRSAAANLIEYARQWAERARSLLYPPHAKDPDPIVELTPAERAFLRGADVESTHAWYWPAQARMVQRLAARGLVVLHDKTREQRGTRQRLALVTTRGFEAR